MEDVPVPRRMTSTSSVREGESASIEPMVVCGCASVDVEEEEEGVAADMSDERGSFYKTRC